MLNNKKCLDGAVVEHDLRSIKIFRKRGKMRMEPTDDKSQKQDIDNDPDDTQQKRPVELFFSYSHRDEKLRDELEKHVSLMKRQGLIKGWHDRKITPSSEWAGEIDDHLNTADIILLLISADFLASDYCYDIEMKRAMQRHEEGTARVVPIILRECDWQDSPFAKLHALPKDARPITAWPNRAQAFTSVSKGLRSLVESLPR